ncbi:MAG: 16S rRNA (cytosine(1402)-N(4))-methyltransferase RsmH [Lentisphaerae bacterium]|nr:16S rRNA (cytosine(1402)-N(4))-methyltransferase RsmH [Lentisphaerota bacterium]
MHEPVMATEVLEQLNVKPGGVYVDGTVGSGGHARAMAERAGAAGLVIGLDVDTEALERARARLREAPARTALRHGSYAEMDEAVQACGVEAVDGVLLDLGVSSEQLDEARRGFTFQADGPLDMRMDPSAGPTAAAWLRDVDEAELCRVLRGFGEERAARRIARRIVRARAEAPVDTTLRLAGLVRAARGGRRGRTHPATQTFQAIRMAVNRELEHLEAGLEAGLRVLKPGGRMAVISFHSVEDRAVKRCFAAHAGRWESLAQGGRVWRGETPAVHRVTRKPLTPSAEECRRNPRARSAKLRVVERTMP